MQATIISTIAKLEAQTKMEIMELSEEISIKEFVSTGLPVPFYDMHSYQEINGKIITPANSH